MTRLALIVALAVLVIPAAAQRQTVDIDTATPEGEMLQTIGTTEDATQKAVLLEQFTAKFPQHASIPWVYGQLQALYLKSEQFDKVFPAVEKLLAIDPSDSEMAHAALKAAEGKKDPDLILKWAVATSESARKAVASKQPEDEDAAEAWKYKVDFAKQVETYTEYALFSTALQTTDPNVKIKLINTLTERNPQSQYLPQLEGQTFLAYRQANDNVKALEEADKLIAANTQNEDVLIFATTQYFDKKDYDKALALAAKSVEVMKAKPAPQGISQPDWEAKKKSIVGLGLYITGMIYSGQSKYAQADATLREALPYLAGNDGLKGPALFNLGLANYNLGNGKTIVQQRIQDALRFNTECAAIRGPFQAQAQKNAAAIRAQFRGLR